jgi:T5orf172 domain
MIMKKYVCLATLARAISMTEAEVLRLAEAGELPKPCAGGAMWKWAAVDAAMSGDGNHARVYFVEFHGFIKIGFTTDLKQRMEQLAGFLPSPPILLLDVKGSFDLETDMHRKFAHLRTNGEWFRKAPELMDYIEQMKNLTYRKILQGGS